MKLLVAKNERAAQGLRWALELGEEWGCCGYGTSLTGKRFDEILVILPVPKTDLQKQMQDTYIRETLWCRLPPGKTPTVIRIKP